LVDANWTAKVSDFGLSKLKTRKKVVQDKISSLKSSSALPSISVADCGLLSDDEGDKSSLGGAPSEESNGQLSSANEGERYCSNNGRPFQKCIDGWKNSDAPTPRRSVVGSRASPIGDFVVILILIDS